MLVVLGILGALGLGAIIFLFLSPKSTRMQKFAALGALIVSAIAILICGICLIFIEPVEEDSLYYFPLPNEVSQPKPQNNIIELIVFLVVMVLLFGLIVFLWMKEQKKQELKKAAAKKDESDFSIDEL